MTIKYGNAHIIEINRYCTRTVLKKIYITRKKKKPFTSFLRDSGNLPGQTSDVSKLG